MQINFGDHKSHFGILAHKLCKALENGDSESPSSQYKESKVSEKTKTRFSFCLKV